MTLLDTLRARIDADGPITVRDFMELAVLDPEHGYYARGPAIGEKGDFYTAANVSLFPQTLRAFATAALEKLGQGARVVELGGGTGALAHGLKIDDITIVEPARGLADAQRARGLHVVDRIAALEPAPTVFLGNEVLDALPVHRVRRTSDGIREVYLTLDGDTLQETTGPISTEALEAAVKRVEPHLVEGAAAEINLDSRRLLAEMASVAPKAIALFIDYGGTTADLVGEHRMDGTLRGYHEHRVTNAYERPGEQDITSDVDFDQVRVHALKEGWLPVGYRVQGEFLAGLGLVDLMMRALQESETTTYMAAKGLLLPGGMGERFKALGITRGLGAGITLPGFEKGTTPGGW